MYIEPICIVLILCGKEIQTFAPNFWFLKSIKIYPVQSFHPGKKPKITMAFMDENFQPQLYLTCFSLKFDLLKIHNVKLSYKQIT